MARYPMYPTTYNRFKTSGYDLRCSICRELITPYDIVESKPSGRTVDGETTGPKLYHASCYDEAHMSFEYDEDTLLGIYNEYGMDELKSIFWEFDEEIPDTDDVEDIIDGILELQEEWVSNNHNT